MRLLGILLLSLCVCGQGMSQGDFRFHVSDEVRTDKLQYHYAQGITISYLESEAKARLVYDTGCRIDGVNQDSFTFTSESYNGDLLKEDYGRLMDEVRKLPLEGLGAAGTGTFTEGRVELEGKGQNISATPDMEVRKAWQAWLEASMNRYAPVEKRKQITRTIMGDSAAAEAVELATLLKDPAKYDGKRVRLSGYYHQEFEDSSFVVNKADLRNYKRSIWLAGLSTFAKPNTSLAAIKDAAITVEGTYEFRGGRGGHMGMWMGELVRITSIERVKAEEKPPAQPIK